MKFKSRFAARNKATVKNLMKNNVNNKKHGMSAINNIKKHIETNTSQNNYQSVKNKDDKNKDK